MLTRPGPSAILHTQVSAAHHCIVRKLKSLLVLFAEYESFTQTSGVSASGRRRQGDGGRICTELRATAQTWVYA